MFQIINTTYCNAFAALFNALSDFSRDMMQKKKVLS